MPQRGQLPDSAKEGRPATGGIRGFGYRYVPATKSLEIVPEEAELIREAVRRLLQGESLQTLCRDWERRGVTTPTGATWWPTALRGSLLRVTITGYRNHSVAGLVRGTWPAIVEKDEWDRLRLMLTDPTRQNRGRVNVRTHLLTGFAYCALCDKPLRAGPTQSGRPTYSCRQGAGFRGCGRIRRIAELVDKEVVDRLLYRLDSPAVRSALAAPDNSSDANDRVWKG